MSDQDQVNEVFCDLRSQVAHPRPDDLNDSLPPLVLERWSAQHGGAVETASDKVSERWKS
jgi:hypothetical protein